MMNSTSRNLPQTYEAKVSTWSLGMTTVTFARCSPVYDNAKQTQPHQCCSLSPPKRWGLCVWLLLDLNCCPRRLCIWCLFPWLWWLGLDYSVTFWCAWLSRSLPQRSFEWCGGLWRRSEQQNLSRIHLRPSSTFSPYPSLPLESTFGSRKWSLIWFWHRKL